jgi:phospholipid/cholesterol/gamma-HCH transport system ATP-binding protein
LRGARDLMPAALSGGMPRRVALARAIALDPMMILYDEPLTGQDPISMGVLLRLVRRMNEALAVTSIVVSHDVAETASISDYLYIISGGKGDGPGHAPDARRDPFGMGPAVPGRIAVTHDAQLHHARRTWRPRFVMNS